MQVRAGCSWLQNDDTCVRWTLDLEYGQNSKSESYKVSADSVMVIRHLPEILQDGPRKLIVCFVSSLIPSRTEVFAFEHTILVDLHSIRSVNPTCYAPISGTGQ